MGEFKEGQYVRVLHTDYLDEFPVGSTFKVGSVYGHGVEPEGENDALFFLNGEIEPWQPRVGERVRYNGESKLHSDNELIGLEGVVTETGDRMVIVQWDKAMVDGVRTGGAKFVENIEPILSTTNSPEQPATLKIEAGKFYKTRDGRKVGPAFVTGDTATFGSTSNYESAVWSDDGRSSSRYDKTSLKDNDIVAEWIDERVVATNDNAEPKFKVGDRVVLIADNPESPRFGVKGAIGKIESIGDESAQVTSETGPHAGDFWYVPISVLAAYSAPAVTPAATIAIVALIENGQPKPSSTPHVHASTDAAEKEAKRLAAKFKGQQFGVFTLTTTHHEPKPVYDHKWQNMAAMGLKIDAIKELRSVAGIDLPTAKRAVEAFDAAA